MSDPRPADQPQNEALRTRLETWVNQHNQALLEEVMATWQSVLARFQPDDALLADLREAVPVPVSAVEPAAPLSLEELSDADEVPLRPAGAGDQDLAAALDLLEGATSQSDLLKRLLDALSPLVERSALFILKQGLASLYALRGFEAQAPVKPGAIVPPPDLEALIQGSTRTIRSRGAAYTALLAPISAFEAAEVAIFPLLHKRRVVALVLVDSGLRQTLDHPEQARALVLVAAAMLASLAAGKEEEPRHHPAPEPEPEPHPSAPTQVVPETIDPAPTGDLDPRTRAAAERLARVLVGDVELYFPAKVAQARTNGNLYQQLRDELERSRATFVERFGEPVENRHRIFTNTIIQLLCDGDVSKLGAAPWA
ncbi:hypothetical protein GETHLI_24170 [Geothrix limicola]|uniref:GAF domain-containing protein n=1 Tax=Geothrix limicola TaxID=2927978 RepID=A0ABQ5QGD8_9BACT|nr:hypothetical protein [Geothrix limicola]GLH73915.1 hypothetical protein GETHLI_24170 [Geothrix limicola]